MIVKNTICWENWSKDVNIGKADKKEITEGLRWGLRALSYRQLETIGSI